MSVPVGTVTPFTDDEIRDFREHQSKAWNLAYNGHKWLATIAARDEEIARLRKLETACKHCGWLAKKCAHCGCET